jgi:chromosome segregation ATPase
MAEPRRRLTERVIDPAFLRNPASKSMDELRTMRDEIREAENELSFERRLCQARIDILSAELEHRAGERESDLVSRLPEILGKESPHSGSPLPARAPDFSIPRNADVPRRRVEEIVGERTLARLPMLTAEEIKSIIRSLAEHERTVSARRKRVHEVMDEIQAEIVRRFSSGEEDPTAALG